MRAPAAIAIDFETFPIRQRPEYPPYPVGVSIKWPGEESRYYACGHPTGNTCTPDDAHAALVKAWASGLPLLFHNAKFDVSVAVERLGLPMPHWSRIHDTMLLAYLYDPHSKNVGLKPLAAAMLDWPAEEKDEVADWIWAHRAHLLAAYGAKVKSRQKAGEWICYAPGDIVGRYARGDTDRTAALFERLWPAIWREHMTEAYDREREVMPIFMENERRGIRVDMERLQDDIIAYSIQFDRVEDWLRHELRAPGLNFDADQDVANTLLSSGAVDSDKFALTASGKLSMAKDSLLPSMYNNPLVAAALGYRNRLNTCLNTFMRPWFDQGAFDGRIHPSWNQIKSERGGTRTGRPSCVEPNLLNLSKNFEGRPDGYKHPEELQLLRLPLVRVYMLPDVGHVWLHRDFNGQELRVFAHFEQGQLYEGYKADAKLDPHTLVGNNIREITGRTDLDRGKVKILNFQAIYGGGAPAAQAQLGCSLAEAKEYKRYHDAALPGRKILADVLKGLARSKEPLRTWGGRLYYCEPSRIIDGRRREFDYKLLNYLVQGSAAEITKQTMIDWANETDGGAHFQCQVYDELNLSAPAEEAERYMAELREVMERDRLEVPMLSEGKKGPSWGQLEKCE